MRNEALAAVAAKHVPAATGAAGMVLFGVPQGVLIAAFLGAVLSFYFRDGLESKKVPTIVFGVIATAFAGAWCSLALPALAFTDIDLIAAIGRMAAKVDASARAGLCALVFQSVWNFGHRWTDKKVESA